MDLENLEGTRRALHGVAELVLAGPQYRESGTIRLRVVQGGFETVRAPALRVNVTELVAGDRAIPLNGTTCRELGTAAGIEAAGPEGLYGDTSGVGPDDVLGVDGAAAAHIVESFARGQEALLRFAPAEEPVLWPEHFDLGITVDEVNYGVSAGDSYLAEPYVYVAPWKPREGTFWDAPFGATRPVTRMKDAAELHGFLVEGRERASRDPLRQGSQGDISS